jgi:hypothetical protein
MLVLVRLEIVLILTQNWCSVCAKRNTGSESLLMWLKWKLVSIYLEIVLILMQDKCTVCAERTTGSKIILGSPDRTPR